MLLRIKEYVYDLIIFTFLNLNPNMSENYVEDAIDPRRWRKLSRRNQPLTPGKSSKKKSSGD